MSDTAPALPPAFEVPRRAILVAGSRAFPRAREPQVRALVRAALLAPGRHVCLLSGGAEGPQTWAEAEAADCGVHTLRIAPLWDLYGERAGYIRSEWLVHFADGILAFWNGVSTGTAYELACLLAHGPMGWADREVRIAAFDQDMKQYTDAQLDFAVDAALQAARGRCS